MSTLSGGEPHGMILGDHNQRDNFSLCEEIAAVYSLVDQVAGAVVQLVNASTGPKIACKRGCNTCCTVFVRATYAEAVEIAKWLLAPSQIERLNRFRLQIELWHRVVGAEVELLEGFLTRYSEHPPLEPDAQLFGEALEAYHRRGFMCPFNGGDGSCEIYPIRPVVCRAFYVAGTSEYCAFDGNGEITVVRHDTLTEISLLARQLLRETSAAAGYNFSSALPAAVEQALALLQNDC